MRIRLIYAIKHLLTYLLLYWEMLFEKYVLQYSQNRAVRAQVQFTGIIILSSFLIYNHKQLVSYVCVIKYQ